MLRPSLAALALVATGCATAVQPVATQVSHSTLEKRETTRERIAMLAEADETLERVGLRSSLSSVRSSPMLELMDEIEESANELIINALSNKIYQEVRPVIARCVREPSMNLPDCIDSILVSGVRQSYLALSPEIRERIIDQVRETLSWEKDLQHPKKDPPRKPRVDAYDHEA